MSAAKPLSGAGVTRTVQATAVVAVAVVTAGLPLVLSTSDLLVYTQLLLAAVVTTGVPSLVEPALAAVRRQGTVSLFGGFPPTSTLALDPNAIHYSEIRLTGSQNATPDQYRRALSLLTVMPDAAAINTHRFPIDEGTKAYESRLGMDGLKSLVIF